MKQWADLIAAKEIIKKREIRLAEMLDSFHDGGEDIKKTYFAYRRVLADILDLEKHWNDIEITRGQE